MRKILPILCIILLLFVLVACDNTDNIPTDTDNNTTNQQTDNPITDDTPSTDDTPTVCTHNFGEWVTVLTATCEKEGTKERSCSKCDTKQIDTINKLEHTIVIDSAIEATCQESGKTEGSHCSVCNAVLVKQEVVKQKEHTIVIDFAVEASCTNEGLTEGSHCSVCNIVLVAQETVQKQEHTIVIDSYLAPTFTSTGLTEGSHCSVCKTVLTEQKEIPIQALEYTLRDDGNYTVSGIGTYIDNALVIPELYNNTAVVSIEKQAFLNCTHISSVVVPSTITSIGSGAFSGCSNIQKMELPLKGSFGRIFGTSPYEGCNSVEQIYMWGLGEHIMNIIISLPN